MREREGGSKEREGKKETKGARNVMRDNYFILWSISEMLTTDGKGAG